MSLHLRENPPDDLQAKELNSVKRSSQTLSLISKRIGQAVLSLAIGTEGIAQAKNSVDTRPVSTQNILTDNELGVFKEAINMSEDFSEETKLLAQATSSNEPINPPSIWDETNFGPLMNAPEGSTEAMNVSPGVLIYDVSTHHTKAEFVTAGSDGKIRIINATNGGIEKTLEGHRGLAIAAEYTPDGSKIVSTGYDSALKVWDANSGALLKTFNLPGVGSGVEISPDGQIAAVGAGDRPLQIIHLTNGYVREIPFGGEACRFSFAPDAQTITVSNGTGVTLWNMATGTAIRRLEGLSDSVYSIDYHPSGQYVAAGDNSGNVMIWNTATGTSVWSGHIHDGKPDGAQGGVWAMAFSNDGSKLITGDHNGAVVVSNVSGIAVGIAPEELQRIETGSTISSINVTNDSAGFMIAVGGSKETSQQIFVNMNQPVRTEEEQLLWELDEAIEDASWTIPRLERQIQELELSIPGIENKKKPYLEEKAMWQRNLDSAKLYLKELEQQLRNASNKNKPKIQSSIDATNRNIAECERNIARLQGIIDNIENEKNQVYVQIENIERQIESLERRMAECADMYLVRSVAAGETLADARASVQQTITGAYTQSNESLPHIIPEIGIKDMDITTNFRALQLLEPNAFIPNNDVPVVSKSGGMVKVYGHVTNRGKRAGYVTLEVYGLSALNPNQPVQQSMQIWLEPGQMQLFVTSVNLPACGDGPRSYVQFLVKTPGEATVSKVRNTAKPTSMDGSNYEQGGVGAMEHNARVIMESPGGIGTIQERLTRYLQSDPESAAKIAGQIRDETSGIGEEYEEEFITAYIASLPREQQIAENVKNQMQTKVLSDLDKESAGILVAMSENDSLSEGLMHYENAIRIYNLHTVYEKTGFQNVEIHRCMHSKIVFTLEEAAMVNFWVDTGDLGNIDDLLWAAPPNIDLTLSGGGLKNPYTSNKSGMSGESISSLLPPGTYTLVIADKTDYTSQNLNENEKSTLTLPIVPVGINIQPHRSQHIQGCMSIAGSPYALPVSMSVAEFEFEQRKTDINRISTLDISKPVWIVIHGRTDRSDSDPMEELARTLQAHDVQVVTLDWRAGAADNFGPIDLNGSKWIAETGRWTSNQLKSLGFSKQNINIVGHSWGTFVGYELAANYDGINSFIALDPAKDSALLASRYNESTVNFANASLISHAFHSSFFGSKDLALTADRTFRIKAEENYENGTFDIRAIQSLLRTEYYEAAALLGIDEGLDAWREHGFAVTLFSRLLEESLNNSDLGISTLFKPQIMGSSSSSLQEGPDHYEGIFNVEPFKISNRDGKTWWKAGNYQFFGEDDSGNSIEE